MGGSGTLKMAEQESVAGLPTPEIEDAGAFVTVRSEKIARFTAGDIVPYS